MVSSRKSSILGPDGRPVDILIGEEFAAPQAQGPRTLPTDAIATGLSPDSLAHILRQAELGNARAYLTLAIEMEERYLHYASQLQTRRLAFDAIPPTLDIPEGVPTKIIDAVYELIEKPEFDVACSDMTDGIAKGFSAVEPIWEYQNNLLQPIEYHYRDPRFFQFDKLTLSELRLIVEGNLDGEIIPAPNMIRHFPRTRSGLPLRVGLARPAAWAYIIQMFSLQDWAAFAEKYGVPFLLGRYHETASPQDKRTLLNAVRSFANDAAAIAPRGMEIEFHSVDGNQGAAVFGSLLSHLDKQISKLVVGQTMTADDGSSLGQAKVHNEVRLDILRADCKQAAATLNRDLIRWFISMNFGPQDVYPAIRFNVSEPEDVKALADATKIGVEMGLKVSQREYRNKLGWAEPDKDEDVLIPPQLIGQKENDSSEKEKKEKKQQLSASSGFVSHHSSCTCPYCHPNPLPNTLNAKPQTDRDVISELAADELSDYEEITDPLLNQLFLLAVESGSYEEVLTKLDELRLDTGPLQDRLARATMKARGIGNAKDL